MSDDSSVISAGTLLFHLGTPVSILRRGWAGTYDQLAIGDMNGDGRLDIAVSHDGNALGLVFTGEDGSLSAETLISEPWWILRWGLGATSVSMADLDGDGDQDLVATLNLVHMIQLFAGNGDGTFELWPSDGYNADSHGAGRDGIIDGVILTSRATRPMFSVIADFNLDGRPDIAAGSGDDSSPWSLDTLTQQPDHRFTVTDGNIVGGRFPVNLAAADFNEDGYTDVATSEILTGVQVFLNNHGAGLEQFGPTYLDYGNQFIITGDFNGDGHADIAGRSNVSDRLSILYGDGSGYFPNSVVLRTSPVLEDDEPGVIGFLAAGDLNNDGMDDIALATRDASAVDLFLSDGTGGFQTRVSIALDSAPNTVAIADLDGDGRNDLVVARDDESLQVLWNSTAVLLSNGPLSLAENSAAGTLVGMLEGLGASPLSWQILSGNADIDGDGTPAFALDPATGALTVLDAGDLDYETTGSFALSVAMTDAAGTTVTDEVTVALSNLAEPGNDRPDLADAAFTLAEGSPAGTRAGQLIATDPDAGDTLSFEIVLGNTDVDGDGDAAFRLDPVTGVLSVNDSDDLDFETTSVFPLEVAARDTAGASDSATVVVSLHNLHDRTGTDGDNFLAGNYTDNLLRGLGGRDTLRGGGGDDVLYGGSGCDRLLETANVDFVLGNGTMSGVGEDIFVSIEEAALYGGVGDNLLDVSAFLGLRTWLSGYVGSDTLRGGAALDTLVARVTHATVLTDTTFSGVGPGTDSLERIDAAAFEIAGGVQIDASDFTGALVRYSLPYSPNGEGITLIGRTTGTDRLDVQVDSDLTLTANALIDTGRDGTRIVQFTGIDQVFLSGGASDNRLDASAFAGRLAVLVAGGGNDTLIGRSAGLDAVRSQGDTDFVLTDTSLTGLGTASLIAIDSAWLSGGAGDNRLDASAVTAGRVLLSGGGGDDTLIGGAGDDSLEGGRGDDLLIGGDGFDRVIARGDTDFTLTDTTLTGLGSDRLSGIEYATLIGGGENNRLDASGFGGLQVVFDGCGGDDTLIGRAAGIDRVRSSGDLDITLSDTQLISARGTAILSEIDEARLIGYSGNTLFDALAFGGQVVIDAGSGADTLLGGRVADRLHGGMGDDVLIGGLGADRLRGGAGADLFVFRSVADSTATARDTIFDLDIAAGDRIDLSAIDADSTTAGNQAFAALVVTDHFDGHFAGPGALVFDRTTHLLYGNVDTDAAADFVLLLAAVTDDPGSALIL